MSFTAKQVTEAIDGFERKNDFYWGELEYEKTVKVPGLGSVEFVDGETGGEGSAEHIWQVFKVGDQLFRKTGYYASYDGSTWDGKIEEVEPEQRTITVYVRRKA